MKEIGNIGCGQATIIFSEIFNKNFLIDIKEEKSNKEELISKIINNKKSDDIFMISKVSGKMDGIILFSLNKNEMKIINVDL